MDLLAENRITEMPCGTNLSYILNDNSLFLPTEYKVLQSQKDNSFVKCMKMLLNGKIQLYYFSDKFKPLSSLILNIDADRLMTVISNLIAAVISVKNNGFLTIKNIDASFDKIFVDPNTYTVRLVYLPIKEHFFDDDAMFENAIRSMLVKQVTELPYLSVQQATKLVSDFQNSLLSMDDLYSEISGKKRLAKNNDIRKERGASTGNLKLVSMNASNRVEIVVNKSEFIIGKKDTNDGVITFNKMISRVHCKITVTNNQYAVTDLQSSNGTYVNRQKLLPNKPYPLKNGDIVRLANSDFQAIIY